MKRSNATLEMCSLELPFDTAIFAAGNATANCPDGMANWQRPWRGPCGIPQPSCIGEAYGAGL